MGRDVTPLPLEFYGRDAEAVARDLLGMRLAHRVDGVWRVGKIVETEAYLGPEDLACHSSKGRTKRNAVMFGPAGHAYVFLIYGIYHCFNVVTGPEGLGAAVLVRAVEPLEGIEARTKGPGLLCRALGIDLRQNGMSLLGPELRITAPAQAEPIEIVARPRIGVDYAGEWASRPLRFYIEGNAYISRR